MTLAPYDKFKPRKCGEHLWGRKQTPFVISMCILRDLPQFFVCSHGILFYFIFLQNGKEARKQKKE
jgi:hypothetical protein